MSAILWPDWVNLFNGFLITMVLCLISYTAGLLIAVIHATVRIFSCLRVLRGPFRAYVEFIRSTPLIVQLMLAYFGLPFIGIVLGAFPAACIVLSLYSGSYLSGFVWGALEAVPRAQWEAGQSLALKRRSLLLYCIAPQATRIFLPTGIGFLVQMVKASALVTVINLSDLTTAGREVMEYTREPLLVWIIVAIGYLIVCTPLSIVGNRLEDKVRTR